MNLLLDTQVVLWVLDGRDLSQDAVDAITGATRLYFSVVSFVEVGVKQSIGRLAMTEDLIAATSAMGCEVLALRPEHGLAVASLPLLHRDPFDRLLIAQAQAERLAIVTSDQMLARYDVTVIDAA